MTGKNENLILPALYGSVTLASLWALAGGGDQLFWSRQYLCALLCWVFVIIALKALKHPLKISFAQIQLKEAILTAAVPAALMIAIFAIAKSHMAIENLIAVKPASIIAALFFSLVLSPAWEIASRALLLPSWGLSGVAFLDALTIGFGLQVAGPFFAFWIMAYLWGKLLQRSNLSTVLASRVLWSLLVTVSLLFF